MLTKYKIDKNRVKALYKLGRIVLDLEASVKFSKEHGNSVLTNGFVQHDTQELEFRLYAARACHHNIALLQQSSEEIRWQIIHLMNIIRTGAIWDELNQILDVFEQPITEDK